MDKHNRDLLIHALKGTLDTASRREFDLWVSNADNLRIYENALRIWDDAQRRAAAYTPDRDRLWEQLQSRIGVSGSPQRQLNSSVLTVGFPEASLLIISPA